MLLESSKIEEIRSEFNSFSSKEEIYTHIITLGSRLPQFNPEWKKEENLVFGCQSLLYLHTTLKDNRLYFAADSEALISKGLAYLLIHLYNGETPETILKCPPTILEELQITNSLTLGRANGLSSLYLRMKKDAVLAIGKQLKLS